MLTRVLIAAKTSSTRRKVAVAGLVLLILALCYAGLTYRKVVSPRSVAPSQADAIVVFAGDETRLALALQLMDDGIAETLVLNRGINDPTGLPHPAPPICDQTQVDYEVICIVVPGDTTRAEAQAFAAMAEEESWTSVIAITADYHLSRASILLNRCYDGVVLPVGSDYPADRIDIRQEFLKLGYTWIQLGRC